MAGTRLTPFSRFLLVLLIMAGLFFLVYNFYTPEVRARLGVPEPPMEQVD